MVTGRSEPHSQCAKLCGRPSVSQRCKPAGQQWYKQDKQPNLCMAKGSKARSKARKAVQHMGGNGMATAVEPQHGSRVVSTLPKLIAFDLDGTLWWPEMFMLSGAPFKQVGREGREVLDRAGETVRLMGASHDIMHELVTTDHFRGCQVAYISRCDVPRWADACLQLFQAAPGVTLQQAAQYTEIYPGSKVKHFRRVHKLSGIPYRDMIFFDNEMRNCRDVATLGVTCIYTPDGMTARVWEEGLRKYAKSAAQRPSAATAAPPPGSDHLVMDDSDDDAGGDNWNGYW